MRTRSQTSKKTKELDLKTPSSSTPNRKGPRSTQKLRNTTASHLPKKLQRSSKKGRSPSVKDKNATPNIEKKTNCLQRDTSKKKIQIPKDFNASLKARVVLSRIDSKKTQTKQSLKGKAKRNSKTSAPRIDARQVDNLSNELERDIEEAQTSRNDVQVPQSSHKKTLKTRVGRVSKAKSSTKLTSSPIKSIKNSNSLFKKPIYANAIKSWDESTHSKAVYDVLEDDGDESYRPIKKKKRKRALNSKKTKMTNIVKKTIKRPLPNKLHSIPLIKSPKPIEELTICEPFQKSAPNSIRSSNDVMDEVDYGIPSVESCYFECEGSNFNEKSQNKNINKSVRLSTFNKGLFSSSTPERSNLITPSIPKTIKFAVDKISTPKFIKPMSIKEQIDNCFGFGESDDDNSLFGGLSPSNIVNAQRLNVPSTMRESRSPLINRPKPTRLNVSIFKPPRAVTKIKRIVSSRPKARRKKSLNDTLLFDDLQDDEKKTSRIKKKVIPNQNITANESDHHESMDEEDEISDENIAVTNLQQKKICRKRKRSSSEGVHHSPKRTKKEEENLRDWEANKSLEFCKIDEFDLSYI